ncbi:MAG: ISKra4 family transposase [Elusimicrobiota bacterium]
MLKQSLSEIEVFLQQEVLKLARKALMHRFAVDPRADPDREYECTKCKGRLRIQEKQQNRPLSTVLGEVEYKRPYGVCDRCGISYAPMDCGLGIPPTGGSVMRTERVCHASVTARSFEAAAEILKEHDGIELSDKQVRVISETEGKRLADERAREVESFRSGEKVAEPGEPPNLIVVTADGGRIQTRRQDEGNEDEQEDEGKGGAWKEDKVGAVYDAVPRKDPDAAEAEKYEGAKARTKTFAASLAEWEDFGWMLCVEALKRGYEKAKEKLFISDGAPSLRTLRQTHFPDATFILDWYHAVEHLAACAKAAFGEGTEECARWYKRMKAKLWAGDLNAVIRAIEKESARVGKPQPKEHEGSPRVILHRNIGYFSDNRKGMDYPRFRAEGWPIGSGVAEGAVKQFGMRMKGTEKFWNGFGCGMGAEEMLALCALHRSEDGRWKAHWRHRSQPYNREPRKKEGA